MIENRHKNIKRIKENGILFQKLLSWLRKTFGNSRLKFEDHLNNLILLEISTDQTLEQLKYQFEKIVGMYKPTVTSWKIVWQSKKD